MAENEPITLRDLETAVQVTALSTQMADVLKDVGGLNLRMDQHEHRHEQEQRDRITSRRWLIGIAIAFLAAIESPLIYMITIMK